MNTNILINGITELLLISILIVLFFYVFQSIQLRIFQANKTNFVINEAFAIYMFGVFLSMAFMMEVMLNNLHAYIGMELPEGTLLIGQSLFWIFLLKSFLLFVLVYSVIFSLCVFLFSLLTTSVNEFRDIINNNRRSAILLSGLLISVFYLSRDITATIFSSLLNYDVNAPIF